MNNYTIVNGELYHHGVKGMKWGVRRYQNADGSLTPVGKKRISKQYKKTADKVTKELKRGYNNMYVNSYNRAADHMNSGGIDKFNRQQEKKYGKKYAERDGYVDDYNKLFEKELVRNMNKSLNEFYSSNKNVQKARSMVEKYGMTEWDDFAKKNEAAIEDVRRAVEKNR